MKKIISGILMLGLLGAGAVYLSSCAQQKGPLSPALNAVANVSRVLPYITSTSTPSGVSQTVRVVFSLPMDPTSFTTATVRLYTMDATAAGNAETPYTNYGMVYHPTSRELVIYPLNGTWQNDLFYHGVITTGVRSVSGRPFDGNQNGIAESAEFDTGHGFWTLGAPPTAPGYVQNSAIVATAAWATNSSGGGINFGGSAGNIPASYSYVTITVQFSAYSLPLNFTMDRNTFFTSATALHPNVQFTTMNGTPVAPVSVSVLNGIGTDDQLQIVLSLADSTKYKMKLRGGLTGIRSSADASQQLLRGQYFDGNGDGAAEAADDTKDCVLETTRSDNTGLPWVRVTTISTDGVGSGGGLRRFIINFSVPTGTGTLDPATVTNANFYMVNTSASPDKKVIAANLELDQSTYPNPRVFMYIPLEIDPSYGDGNRTLYVFVSNNVKSSDGVAINNGDGVTGEDDDNVYSGGYSVYNFGN